MPTINGVKMACEPCIRGHRSTKCTHAHDRLMVPVRKPGRPLSACPHPKEQRCGCGGGGVTAAIPRNQACHCGTPAPQPQPQPVPMPMVMTMHTPMTMPPTMPPTPTDVASPTRSNFKIQKNPRPTSGRKQSFDPTNLERMDMNSVRLNAYFTTRSLGFQVPPGEAEKLQIDTMQNYAGAPNPYNMNLDENGIPILPDSYVPVIGFPQPHHHNSHLDHGTLMTPNGAINNDKMPTNGNSSCCGSKEAALPILSAPTTNGNSFYPTIGIPKEEANATPKLSSCCAPKNESPINSNGTASTPIEQTSGGGCCSSKDPPPMVKSESMSSGTMTPQMTNGMIPQPLEYNPAYSQYAPQSSIFTYPPTYGSFQNPLQPEAWRQSFMNNNYGLPQVPPQVGPYHHLDAPIAASGMDTIHNCSCGIYLSMSCCAAHPYNQTTQDYVRSAWEQMGMDSTNDLYNSNQTSPNGVVTASTNGANGANGTNSTNGDIVSSPAGQTPNSTTNSQNGEDQNLPPDDFFFVTYALGEGCGGDETSCPCGDDCKCIGCAIHTNSFTA